MFLPLKDVNRLRYIRWQWVTLFLILSNVAVQIAFSLTPVEFDQVVTVSLGYIPAVVNDYAELDPALVLVPEETTVLTYAFIHAGWMHLLTNMAFLWVFGDNVEDATGHVRFVILYVACAIAGAAAHGLLTPDSQQPLVGASGAVAGVSTAYLMLHPKVRVWVLVLGRIPLPLPAWIPLGLWIGLQVVMIVQDPGGEISWAAHVGGIVAGALLILVLRRPGVTLFDRKIVAPEAAELAPTAAQAPPPPAVPWGRGAG